MSRVTRKEKKQDFINDENKEVKKDITTKTNAVSTQKTKNSANKKSTTKSNIKKASTKNSTTSKKNTAKATSNDNNSIIPQKPSPMLEYYDLPYRYNQTIVRILAQTPTTLFVYWDISDDDRMILQNLFYLFITKLKIFPLRLKLMILLIVGIYICKNQIVNMK